MNLVSIKALSEVSLTGVRIEWVKEDKGIKEIHVRDAKGGHLVIKSGPSYSETLKLLVPQPFEEATRWQISGRFLDVADICEHFEHDYEAREKFNDYERKAGNSDSGLKLEKVSVLVDDDGKVVKPVAERTARDLEEAIPF